MALLICILGKFVGVVCHCFSPRLGDPTFTARCLHVRNDARDPSSEKWNYGRERLSGNFAYMASLFTPLGIFYMPQIYDMGPTALLPHRRKACWGFFLQCRGSTCFRLWSVYWVPCNTLHSTQYTHHNLKHMLPQHCKTYNDVFLLINSTKVNYNQVQCKLPEDGPSGPKHVGANVGYFNVNFNILYG
jgi:hypothetical protein